MISKEWTDSGSSWSFSARIWRASLWSRPSDRIMCFKKLIFLRVPSISRMDKEDFTILSGRPGKPAPEPISSNRARSGMNLAGASESKKCLMAISRGSVMAVRLILRFQLSNSAAWAANAALMRSSMAMPSCWAPSTIRCCHSREPISIKQMGLKQLNWK